MFEIRDGALAANGSAQVAAGAGSFGDALITGAATLWDCAGMLTVGKAGLGSVTISDGAAVTSEDAAIAQQESSFGNVAVRGVGSSWVIEGPSSPRGRG